MTFNAKMTFENHLRSVSSAAAQKLGIMRKFWQVFHDRSLLPRSFLELCPAGFGVLLTCVVLSCRFNTLKYWTELLLLLLCLGLSGRAGPLLRVCHRSNPQGALLQAEWLGAEGEVGAIWPYSLSGVTVF